MSDPFESKFMADEADVRYRDKRVSRGMAGILAAPALFSWALAVFVAFANASSDKPVPAAALPFVVGAIALFGVGFAVLSLTFAVLRTVVTSQSVIVRYGLWGPEIPLSAIVGCKVMDYDFTKFGGWGLRRGVGGVWAYVPGPGKVVEIEYEEGGATKRVQIGAEDAARLATEIERARTGARVGGARIAENVANEDALAELTAEDESIALDEARTEGPGKRKKRKR